MKRRERDGEEDVLHKHFMMPNIGLALLLPEPPGDDHFALHLAWRVPKNDTEHWGFAATALR